MKLQNNLYRIISKEVDASICYAIELDAGNLIYQAHFPGEPITPGACIIQIAKELLEDYTGKKLAIQSMKNVKFLHVISPLETQLVTYLFEKIITDETGEYIKAVCQVRTDSMPSARISFTCSQ